MSESPLESALADLATAAPKGPEPTPSEGVRAAVQPVAVVGLGHVGLPLAGDFLAGGRGVIGFELDSDRAAAIAAGASPFAHLDPKLWAPRQTRGGEVLGLDVRGGARALDYGDLERCAGVILCLPTPLDRDGAPDLTAIEAVCSAMAPHLRPGHTVVVASTVWPGATRGVVLPRLASSGLRPGVDLFVAASPEREDPGRLHPPSRRVPRLVGGVERASTEAALALLGSAAEALVPVESAEVAELAKMHENLFRAVNVALVGELKQIAAALGIDVWQVLDAAATKPFGYMGFEPGPGLGGHCLPVDPHYLAYAAQKAGAPSRFVALAAEVGRELPRWIAARIEAALLARGRSLAGARVTLLGVAYKAGVADLRESPALALWDQLEARGAAVEYLDPLVPCLYRSGSLRRSTDLDAVAAEPPEVLVLLAAQPGLDLERVARCPSLVVDTRGALRAQLGGRPNYLPA